MNQAGGKRPENKKMGAIERERGLDCRCFRFEDDLYLIKTDYIYMFFHLFYPSINV